MSTGSKDALRASVRLAQEHYEVDTKATREARREAFAKAQEEGLSLREISEEVGLHLSRIGQIIEGK
jgi:DNA-directed RNA polymerase specialized sigma24 family protein